MPGERSRASKRANLVARLSGSAFDLLDDVVAREHAPEDDVLAVEPWRVSRRDEELAADKMHGGAGRAQRAWVWCVEWITSSFVHRSGRCGGRPAVGVAPRVRHRQSARAKVLQLEE